MLFSFGSQYATYAWKLSDQMCTYPIRTSYKYGRSLRDITYWFPHNRSEGFNSPTKELTILCNQHQSPSLLAPCTTLGRAWMAALIQAMVKTHSYSILYNSRSIRTTKYILWRWTNPWDPNFTEKTIIMRNRPNFFPLILNGSGSHVSNHRQPARGGLRNYMKASFLACSQTDGHGHHLIQTKWLLWPVFETNAQFKVVLDIESQGAADSSLAPQWAEYGLFLLLM